MSPTPSVAYTGLPAETFGGFQHSLGYVWDVATLTAVVATPGGGGAGGPATVADGADVTQGATTDAAWVSGAGSVVSILKTIASSGASAGLTDPQLRASAVPVSLASVPTHGVTGTFWQATQPVSLATAPTTPVTGTFWQATQPVSLAAAPTTPVTGTFWQATQPVSIATAPALVASSAVIGHVIVDTAPTTAVTGTFWQATQPVSGTVSANATLSAETTKVIGTVNIAAAQTIAVTESGNFAVTQATPANLQATVTPVTALVKGTQGATGFSTQDLKDGGRTSIMVTASVASTATAETLITLTKSAGLAATTTGSSLTITTGKKFRIQAISASVRNSTGTTAGTATLNLRGAVAGATTTASPLQIHMMVPLPAAATPVLFPLAMIPDGFEIDSNGATNTYGVTITHPQWVTASVVATFDLTIIGFEY